jgi:hypothetical protein
MIDWPRREKPFSKSKVCTVHEKKIPFQYEVGVIWKK